MFNLPWYAWINIFALPLMWLFMTLDFTVLGAATWLRRLVKYYIAACVASIFLYWNPQLYHSLVPVSYFMVGLIVPFTLWNLWLSLSGVIETVDALLFPKLREENAIEHRAVAVELDEVPLAHLHNANVDLDVGVTCQALEQARDKELEHVATLLAQGHSTESKLESFQALMGGEEEFRPDGITLFTCVAVFVLYASVSLPPMVMSFGLL